MMQRVELPGWDGQWVELEFLLTEYDDKVVISVDREDWRGATEFLVYGRLPDGREPAPQDESGSDGGPAGVPEDHNGTGRDARAGRDVSPFDD